MAPVSLFFAAINLNCISYNHTGERMWGRSPFWAAHARLRNLSLAVDFGRFESLPCHVCGHSDDQLITPRSFYPLEVAAHVIWHE